MKIFHFDGPTWAFLTPEQMYDEEGELRKSHKHYINTDIYFLSVMKKCLFNPSKTRVTLNGNIKCEILIGDPGGKKFRRVHVLYPLAEILYSVPSIKAFYQNRNEFLFRALYSRYTPKSTLKRNVYAAIKELIRRKVVSPAWGFKLLLAIYSREIKVRHENRYEINIFDPLAESITDDDKANKAQRHNPALYALNNADWDTEKKEKVDFTKLPGANSGENCRLKVDQIVNLFNVDIGGQRIVYVGKTEREPFERLFPHEKLNEMNGKLSINEFESLVIHLLGFSHWDEPIYSLPPSTSVSKSKAISVAEAELINYFKPQANDDYVKDKGKPRWDHIKRLNKMGYEKIRGLLDIDCQYCKFYTEHLGGKGEQRHEIEVDLRLYKPKKNRSIKK